jgi:hypothetical protein
MGYTASFVTGATGQYSIAEIDGHLFDLSDIRIGEVGVKFELPEMKLFRTVTLNELISVTKAWAESWNLLATKVHEEGIEVTETVDLYREASAGTRGWKVIEFQGTKYAIKAGKYLIV